MADNKCRVYDVRPRACAGYPHTNQRKFHLNIGITKNNLAVCPAAYQVVLKLEEIYK
jgi:Fe-S-cluster containining protein